METTHACVVDAEERKVGAQSADCTRRMAMSFAPFEILVLVSPTSNGFLGPFLAKRIELRLTNGAGEALAGDFRIVLASAALAVFLGILLVPTG